MNSKNWLLLSISAPFIFALLLLYTDLLAGQSTNYPDRITNLKKAYQKEKMKSDSGAVILLKDQKVFIENDGTTIKTIHVIGEISNTEAASDYSQVGFNFDSYYEQLELEFANTGGYQ